MAELYQDDLARFAELSGIDVSTWSTTRVANGTLDPAEVAAKLAPKLRTTTPDRAEPEDTSDDDDGPEPTTG